jgi:hypothetical protein
VSEVEEPEATPREEEESSPPAARPASARRSSSPLRSAWRSTRAFLRRAFAPRGPRRRWVLVVGLLTIVIWQWGFASSRAKIDDTYKLTASSGLHNEQYFVYFYWYTGLFPVASTAAFIPCGYRCTPRQESLAPTKIEPGAAESLMRSRPETLVMDASWTWYAGDRGKIFLYMLDTWLKGAPWRPSVKPFHRFAFTGSLALLFFALWWVRRPVLGAAAVAFLGSNPFQLYEVNVNENVFGWSITTAILMLAIHVPLLTQRRIDPRIAFAWPIVTALLMATIRTFRSEPIPILAGALLSYAFVHFRGVTSARETWLRRGALLATFFAFFFVGHAFWSRYFVTKHEEARAVLAKIGGHPFPGPIRMYHHFWHPVWCGLGDFDKEKGYEWNDLKALAYAKPILQSEHGQYVPSGTWDVPRSLDEYWDEHGIYKKLPYDVPHYSETIRDKVLSDIKSDPGWYASILAKRVKRVIAEATPVRVAGWKKAIDIPGLSAWLFVPLLAMLALARERFAAKLLIFTLPTLTTALVVYSGRGVAYYGIYHLIMAAALVAIAVEGARTGVRAWRRRRDA